MNPEHDNKAGRPAATKVGGMRVPNADHPVPVVRKEHERKLPLEKADDEKNEDERQLEKQEKFEYERQTRLAAGERLARMQENQPKNQFTNNFKQKQNIYVDQPVLHNHDKSGAAAQQ